MKNYIFKTMATMKEYNNKSWWIDSGIVRDIHIAAAYTRVTETKRFTFA